MKINLANSLCHINPLVDLHLTLIFADKIKQVSQGLPIIVTAHGSSVLDVGFKLGTLHRDCSSKSKWLTWRALCASGEFFARPSMTSDIFAAAKFIVTPLRIAFPLFSAVVLPSTTIR